VRERRELQKISETFVRLEKEFPVHVVSEYLENTGCNIVDSPSTGTHNFVIRFVQIPRVTFGTSRKVSTRNPRGFISDNRINF